MNDSNIAIDVSKCLACGNCVDRCIMDNLRLVLPPCRQASLLDINYQGILRLAAQGIMTGAARDLRRCTPFGGFLAAWGDAPASRACSRGHSGGALNFAGILTYLVRTQEDAVYGPADKTSPAARQLLHAWKLEFAHPVSGEPMSFTCPPPEDFPRAMLALERCMRRVILTGMPGCGKSAVLERMEARRIPVWSADKAVAAQYLPGADGWRLMRQRWGDAFFDESGRVNRTALTRLLAETPGMRRELERMIHPLVRDSMETFFRKAQERGEGVAVAEVPLWFETGWTCPGADIAVIVCPEDVRHARLRETRSWSDAKIAAVESWQWKPEDKIAAADLLIRNDGTLDDLDREVGAFLDALTARQKSEESGLEERWRALWSGEEGQTRD